MPNFLRMTLYIQIISFILGGVDSKSGNHWVLDIKLVVFLDYIQGIQRALKSLKVLEFHYLFSRSLNMLEFFYWFEFLQFFKYFLTIIPQ